MLCHAHHQPVVTATPPVQGTAAWEGWTARKDNLGLSDNPYLRDTESGYGWETGWKEQDTVLRAKAPQAKEMAHVAQ